jgi:hypothetical protein
MNSLRKVGWINFLEDYIVTWRNWSDGTPLTRRGVWRKNSKSDIIRRIIINVTEELRFIDGPAIVRKFDAIRWTEVCSESDDRRNVCEGIFRIDNFFNRKRRISWARLNAKKKAH